MNVKTSFPIALLALVFLPSARAQEPFKGAPSQEQFGTVISQTTPGPSIPSARGIASEQHLDSTVSPSGKLKAFYRDCNLWLSDGKNETQITTDGNSKTRIKNGYLPWVYGEELEQEVAIWWSPAGDKIAYYRFDESRVPHYFLQLNQTGLQSVVDTESYPKAGESNPVVDLFVYDIATKKTTRIDVRAGKPFDDAVVGHYVYRIAWTLAGKELTFYRMNRRQNILELTACSPETGKCRVVVREEWPASWVDYTLEMQYLKDGKRFIWSSERTGFKNFYLYDLSGKLLATLTHHPFEVADIVRVDESAGVMYYMARDGDNYMKLQLHKVQLDGKNDRRLTDPAFMHRISFSKDGKYLIDVAMTHDQRAVTQCMDTEGKPVASCTDADGSVVPKSKVDQAKVDPSRLKRVELFTFKAADDTTVLYGMLHFPPNFDPHKRYPMLVSIYGGPATNGASEEFAEPSPLTESGFLVARFDLRSAAGRGKRFLDAIYEKLGVVEVDDAAAGVRALDARPYVDKSRVGIVGTSYGGYVSVMALERYPDLFAAAVSNSPPTDWRNYDTIYTERYMWLPDENAAGYKAGNAMTYVSNLKGRLMLYYGTADNNVHPSNTLQLIAALQHAGKSFDLQVGPDRGHSSMSRARMLEFFTDNLMKR
jgi:dipeptidyl-peptidase-4